VSVTIQPTIVDDPDRASFFDELFEQWRREASESPPSIDDFAEMLVHIRANAALDRDIFSKSQPPDGLTAGLRSLRAVLIFLEKQRWLWEAGDLAPLLRLKNALDDLTDGKGSDLLKPAKKNGRPGVGRQRGTLQALAAQTLNVAIAAGEDIDHAAGRIARELKRGHPDIGIVNAETIKNWRQRQKQGPGAGAPDHVVNKFKAPLNGFPDEPKRRFEILLKALANPGGVIG
jgi:hypothetical protein